METVWPPCRQARHGAARGAALVVSSLAWPRRGWDQPTQRISCSLRATGGGTAVGWPTMIGATGTHSDGRPSASFPSGMSR